MMNLKGSGRDRYADFFWRIRKYTAAVMPTPILKTARGLFVKNPEVLGTPGGLELSSTAQAAGAFRNMDGAPDVTIAPVSQYSMQNPFVFIPARLILTLLVSMPIFDRRLRLGTFSTSFPVQ